jgi:hypothetical protein
LVYCVKENLATLADRNIFFLTGVHLQGKAAAWLEMILIGRSKAFCAQKLQFVTYHDEWAWQSDWAGFSKKNSAELTLRNNCQRLFLLFL